MMESIDLSVGQQITQYFYFVDACGLHWRPFVPKLS